MSINNNFERSIFTFLQWNILYICPSVWLWFHWLSLSLSLVLLSCHCCCPSSRHLTVISPTLFPISLLLLSVFFLILIVPVIAVVVLLFDCDFTDFLYLIPLSICLILIVLVIVVINDVVVAFLLFNVNDWNGFSAGPSVFHRHCFIRWIGIDWFRPYSRQSANVH